jgi:Domain of unknown function (DUF4834)
MNFIASLIIIYIVFRLISWVFVRILAYKVKKATGMNGNRDEESDDMSQQKSRKKIIRKDAGDYVDFEEIDKKK